MYSPVEGRSGSNVSGSRRSSQEEMRPSPPSQAAPSSISTQVGGMTPMAPLSPGSESTSSYVPVTTNGQPKGSLIQMSIPDSLIGAILGRGGSTLNELQSSTNTRIRISQRECTYQVRQIESLLFRVDRGKCCNCPVPNKPTASQEQH